MGSGGLELDVHLTYAFDGGDPLGETLRYLRERPVMIALLAGTLVVGFAGDPVNTLSPALADDFGLDEGFVGLQVGVFGARSAVGSLVAERVQRRFGLGGTTKLGMSLQAVGLVVAATAPLWFILLIGWFFAGLGFLFGTTSLNAALQARVDEQLRGRVMSLWGAAFLGSRPIAALTDGFIADAIALRAGVIVAGITLVAGLLVMRWVTRRARERGGAHAD